MSDNMEHDKTDLTPKEREEVEEMKQELLDMKMYETWYTYKDMKQILGVINESKSMANIVNEEKAKQKDLFNSSNICTQDVTAKTNLMQELEIQGCNDMSSSKQSYKSNRATPMREQVLTHGCDSPDLEPVIIESRNSMYKGKKIDNENMLVKLQDNLNMRDTYSHNINKYTSLKSTNSLQASDIHSIEIKMDTHSECEQKSDNWQINPLDSCISENDVPLQEPNWPVVQDCIPSRLCEDADTPEMLDKLLHALNLHLKETAEIWYSWNRTTDTKFQWGSPIQVGLSKDSLDKKSLTKLNTEQNEVKYMNKHNDERSNKRKASLVLSSSNTEKYNNDEDEKTAKKPKIRSHEDINKVLYVHEDVCVAANNEKGQQLSNNNINRDFYNIKIDNCEMESKRKAKECLSPELISLNQRKIMPPNVRKSINKKKEHTNDISPSCSLANSSNEKQNTTNLMSKEKTNILNDEEVPLEVKQNNIHDNVKTIPENIKVKPLPMKSLSRRIQNECTVLEQIQLEKQKKIEMEKEEAKKKGNEERKKREEFYKKQINEIQEREKQKEEKEKFKEERCKRWNNIVDIKSRKKVSKDKEKLQNVHTHNESNHFEDTEKNRLRKENTSAIRCMEIIEDDLINNINCPICNKSFPIDQIETHAAGCDQYVVEDECKDNSQFENKTKSINSNNIEILECSVCSKFKTTSGMDYEEHVNNCLQRQEDQSFHEHTGADISNILNSPIRCYRPISEQTESCIDYKKQFSVNNKTQTHSSKKRKR